MNEKITKKMKETLRKIESKEVDDEPMIKRKYQRCIFL